MTDERKMALRLAADVLLRVIRDSEGQRDDEVMSAMVEILDATVDACAPRPLYLDRPDYAALRNLENAVRSFGEEKAHFRNHLSDIDDARREVAQ